MNTVSESRRQYPTRSLSELEDWIKVNRLIHGTKKNILNDCLKEITESFEGIESFLLFITKLVNQEQLQLIHQIISKQKTNNVNKAKSNYNIDSPFSILPNECISHICGYISKQDINKGFKQTSRQIAIICLQEINKITISTYNASMLLNNNKIDLYHWNISKYSQQTRHNKNKRYYSLFEEWSNEYKISEHNLMIFEVISYDPLQFQLLNCSKIRLMSIQRNKTYLICNKQEIAIMDKQTVSRTDKVNIRSFDIRMDKYDTIKHYRLLFLEYFDVINQNINIIQFILYRFGDTLQRDLMDYIKNKLIKENKRFLELNNTLKMMSNDRDNDKIDIYYWWEHQRFGWFYPEDGDKPLLHYLYTFELNWDHSWIENVNLCQEIKEQCKENMNMFYENGYRFCRDIKNISVSIINDKIKLKKLIKNYYESQLNEEEKRAFVYDLNCIGDVINNEKIQIRMHKTSYSGKLRMKISQLMGNMIDPKNIELYKNEKRLKWNEEIGADSIRCELLIDDITYFAENIIYFNIRIFKPMQCPHPFYFGDEDIPKMIQIRYKHKFKFIELIQHLFQTIYKAKDNVFRDEYIDELQLFYGDEFDDNYDENNIPLMNDKISCIISTKPDKNIKTKDYSLYDTFGAIQDLENVYFDLFMITSKQHEISRNIKMKIKFISTETENPAFNEETDIKTVGSFNFDGIPLDIWINKEDTLQCIKRKYFDKTKKFIKDCYRIKIGDKIEKIDKELCSEYKPYYQFIAGYPEDYMVFIFDESRYSLYIYRPTPLLMDRYYFIEENAMLIYKGKDVMIKEMNRDLNKCSVVYSTNFEKHNVSLRCKLKRSHIDQHLNIIFIIFIINY